MSNRQATAAQHRQTDTALLFALRDIHRCDERGFELVTAERCLLMGEDKFSANKCFLYASHASKSCLRCMRGPVYRTVKAVKERVKADFENHTLKLRRLKMLKGEHVEWVKGFCPECQPDKTGDEKNLLNGKCRACHNKAKHGASTPKRAYTKRATTFVPPDGYMLLKECTAMNRVREEAKREKRELGDQLDILIDRALASKGPTIDFAKIKRLMERRKELGTQHEDPKLAYREAFDRMAILIDDIMAGDL